MDKPILRLLGVKISIVIRRSLEQFRINNRLFVATIESARVFISG